MDRTGFSKDQLRQIDEGKREGLDVSVYAKKEYTAMHMQQLRRGLEQGLDVSVYADPSYDWFQMEEIRKGLKDGLDVSVYASQKVSYQKMREVRRGLKSGIHLEKYLSLDADLLRQVRTALEQGVNIQRFLREGYIAEQLEQIIPALKEQLDIAPFLDKAMRGVAVREIRLGLESHVDVSRYASPEYSWQQMREIRLGLENGVDVSAYLNPYFEHEQMRQIRLGLEGGFDVSGYAKLMYTARDMEERRSKLKDGLIAAPSGKLPEIDALLTPKREPGGIKPVMISVSPDEMDAYVIADKSLQCYGSGDVVEALRARGVVYGIDYDAIERLISGQTKDAELVQVAKGKWGGTGEDGWYEFFFRTEVARTPKLLENGKVDYQNIEWFETVEEGQKIALYHPAKDGENGLTVTGRILCGKRGRELPVLKGTGWSLSADGKEYIAAMGGCIQIHGNLIQISQMYVFDDITLSTGSVNETGTVYIRGSVGSGARIRAGADIIVDGFIEGATLECEGTVFLRKGMNGQGRGSVKAGGSVTGSFFEGVKIYAEGDLTADYCMDCEIQVQGKINLSGSRGALIGGQADALCGMEVYNVGNSANVPTWVRIGQCGGSLERKRRELEDEMAETERELTVFRSAYADFIAKYPPEVRNGLEIFLKVERAIYTKEIELNDLNERNHKLDEFFEMADKAVAIIRGVVYEGVTFEFNGKIWKSKMVANVRIKSEAKGLAIYTNG